MIYDTTSVNGKYWACGDWCKLINDTFHEYVDCNMKLSDDKKAELGKLYEECENETKFSKTRFRYVSLVTVLRSQS